MNEQELLEAIDQANEDRAKCKKQIALLKREIDNQESDLIEATLRKDRLIEKLGQFRDSDPTCIPSERDLEIKDFRERFPALCEKIEPQANIKK